MNNIVLLAVFVLGLVFMQYAEARSVGDIITKYIDANGGKGKLNAIRSLYMEGSREMMGSEAAVKVSKVQNKLFRIDFEHKGIMGYAIVTPTEGWSFIPLRSPNVESIPAEQLKNLFIQMDITGPLVDYIKKGNKAELQGKEIIGGRVAYKIKIILTSGS